MKDIYCALVETWALADKRGLFRYATYCRQLRCENSKLRCIPKSVGKINQAIYPLCLI